jgi:3,4-dihydroxy 2-butanone 4-phosphate synthase/GTP cyclohydrolase II
MTGRDPAHRVAVDLRGTGTGISAAARAATVAALGDPATLAADLVRPGHVVPLRAHDSGVLGRQGLGEVAVDLARMAGLHPAGVLSTIVSVERPGRMACRDELARFALHHGLPIVSIGEIVDARLRSEPQVERGPSASLPTAHGVFRAIGFRGVHDDAEHLALVAGQLGSRSGDGQAVLVHVHVECLAGDVFGSCACGAVLDDALAMIAAAGRGVVVYTRPPGAARACGLLADPATGRLPGRNLAAAVLRDLGVTSARLPDSDPHLVAVLADYGIAVDAARHAVAG